MKQPPPNRVFILGNIAGGKTKLARRLSGFLNLPVIHIDGLEFNADLSKKPMEIIRTELQAILTQPQWILDGHGPLDLLPKILQTAETIIYLDLPYTIHWQWLLKRQLLVFFRPRPEMPQGAQEWNWLHTKKLFHTLKKQDRLMKPELQRILHRPENQAKLIHVQSVHHWQDLFHNPGDYFAQRKG